MPKGGFAGRRLRRNGAGWARILALFTSMGSNREQDEAFMGIALEEAHAAAREGEVPVGAVLVKDGLMLARDHNRSIALKDPTAHAEILVLRKGGEVLRNYRLVGTVLYVTAEPCPMCAAAMVHGRVARLVFGTLEPKLGAVESRFRLLDQGVMNHRIVVEKEVREEECAEVLKAFFASRRRKERT